MLYVLKVTCETEERAVEGVVFQLIRTTDGGKECGLVSTHCPECPLGELARTLVSAWPTIGLIHISGTWCWVLSWSPRGVQHNPSTAFRHLPPNYARFSYATNGALFISAQLSTDAVSALRKLRVYDILPSTCRKAMLGVWVLI